jgi:DNA excision repair protein ERCC-2
MAAVIEVSARTLAEYAHRSGSIESGFRTAVPLAEGTRIHKLIQDTYEEPDQREVHLAGELEWDGLLFRLEGRCDGLRFEEDTAVIEEIKSTSGSLESMDPEGYAVHWAQAVCYAYLYARREGRPQIRVRLLYVQVESGMKRSIVRDMDADSLERSVKELLACYAPFARQRAEHLERRGASVKALSFPHGAYRPGQRHLAGAVYKSIAEGSKLFARAPTGTGKTISTLFPAVKAIGEGHLEKILYVTARTTTRAAAEEALALMEAKGLVLRRVTLTAKDKICFQEEVRCTKEACPYADGYYDRINGALLDLLGQEPGMNRRVVEACARKHRVCPFELSLDAAYESDVIIGDYNYVFDPRISLKRMWEEDKRRTAVLADEAHNLPDRAREMYSAEISKGPFLKLQRMYKGAGGGLYEAAKAVNACMLRLRKEHEARKQPVLPAPPEDLPQLLEEFCLQAEQVLAAGGSRASMQIGSGYAPQASAGLDEEEQQGQLLTDTYFAAQGYIRASEWYDERFTAYVEQEGSELRLRLFCLDPSALLKQAGKGYRSHIFFSATLSPLGFYRELLGGCEDDYTVSIPSPFRKEQLEVRLAPLSVRFRDREASIGPIAGLLQDMNRERKGNMLVFFSSYEYMNAVHERYMGNKPASCRVLLQHSGMTEPDRDAFLAEFQPDLKEPVTAFAVLGGIFSEGVDLPGDRLNAVVVVGVGLPQVGLERNLMKDYYDQAGRNGFDYAYIYPGMGKVLQAGGRLIRTDEDTGTLLLVDDRFENSPYRELLPAEWKPLQVLDSGRRLLRERWMRLYEP